MSSDALVIHEYMQYARDCRELAATLSSAEYRRMLETMADRWAQLAADQRARIRIALDTE
jgi:hypothetical protein